MRTPSAGVISPRATAARTVGSICRTSSTVRNADQIVVLDHGRIVEAGDHGSLLASDGRYAELAAA